MDSRFLGITSAGIKLLSVIAVEVASGYTLLPFSLFFNFFKAFSTCSACSVLYGSGCFVLGFEAYCSFGFGDFCSLGYLGSLDFRISSFGLDVLEDGLLTTFGVSFLYGDSIDSESRFGCATSIGRVFCVSSGILSAGISLFWFFERRCAT